MNPFKNKTPLLYLTLVLCTILTLAGCDGCKKKTHRSFEGNPVNIRLERFEQELFSIDPNQAEEGLKKLYQKYQGFYLSYARDILAMKENPADSLFLVPMSLVVKYQPFRNIRHKIDSVFGDLHELNDGLSKAMGRYQAAFPEEKIPTFITFLSEFGYANVTYDTIVGIGLDMYMKEVYENVYRSSALTFPEYMIRKLSKPYILPNAVKAIAISRYEEQTYRDKRFLAMMVYEGKVRYFAKALLPDVHDTLILGYTSEQLKWCVDNEPEMWAHYIEKQLLYQGEPSQFIRYFNDGPFTSADGVPPESAPAIGAWTGLQIVNKYMNEHPEVSLKELMEEKDFDKILKESKYRPETGN